MHRISFILYKRFSDIAVHRVVIPKVAIIGSGPAGFYAAQQLIKLNNEVVIDIYERLPVPFGLVRYGVAPDHPEVKNVINTFTKTAKHSRVNFIGNVKLGKDVSLSTLKEAYHAVILAYGADKDKEFGIPGENKPNVISARRFVGWYNGLPEDNTLLPNLNCEHVVVLGQGNVAVDVARILLTPVDILKKTDITQYALEALAQSRVKSVHLIGRRGPLQVAFTIKEFREMLRLPQVCTSFKTDQMAGVKEIIPKLVRPRKRLTELMVDAALKQNKGNADKMFYPLFLRSPVSILGSGDVTGVRLSVNTLEGSDFEKQTAVTTEKYEDLHCGMVLRSIGYQSTKADPDIPFDLKACKALPAPGIYSAGWLCTGPVGVILTTMSNAFEAGILVAKHIADKSIDVSQPKPGLDYVKQQLLQKGIQTVSFSDWERIDGVEIKRGKEVGKPREKITNVNEMLQIASQHR
ncbi:NADPH:adrenodoxin oxidoreductase, mitochondrial [Lycorma delicatula]|uniref:NADPH:adrenodoxin oxidoreductase, mitochondrial n=1 Tax=Lycorma delicatula TaxID=130591 RepID=UPI003F5104BA